MFLTKKGDTNLLDLNLSSIDFNIVKVINKSVALKYKVIPLKIEDNKLVAAIEDINNMEAIDYLKFVYGTEVILLKCDSKQINIIIERVFNRQDVEVALESLRYGEKTNIKVNDFQISELIEHAPIVKLTNSVINEGLIKRASDIHIEPFKNKANIRYRIDGVLEEVMDIPREVYFLLCSRIKVLCGMDITEKRISQDGKMEYMLGSKRYDLRVSTLPTVYGEKIVIRILYKEEELINLNTLGFDDLSVINLKNSIRKPFGLVLITGPTGSGKSTTLYAILNELDKKRNNIVTIEDPVEYTINGISQVNINIKSNITFAKGLRSILRQDPDIIMIGEIRDEETAQIAVRAAITGHLVFSTLHTNDSVSAIYRLIDMGVPSYLVSDAVIAVISQRLVRKICPYCKQAYEPNEEIREKLNLIKGQKLYKGSGCSKCNELGYMGRTIIYELMPLTFDYKQYIQRNSSLDKLREISLKNGVIPISQNLKNLIKNGVTSYEEMIRINL